MDEHRPPVFHARDPNKKVYLTVSCVFAAFFILFFGGYLLSFIFPPYIDSLWPLFFVGTFALLMLVIMLDFIWCRSRKLRRWILFIALGAAVICIVAAIIVVPHLPADAALYQGVGG
ncbi:MAG: hypothetical protein FWF49_00040 [Oscillospiraceae bacterium]|nr:hypothetical protein [Oscillospiraceae bacterium]